MTEAEHTSTLAGAEPVKSGTIPRRVLIEIRNSLQFASDNPGGGITDTIWMMDQPGSILDFIDAALADHPYDPNNPEHTAATRTPNTDIPGRLTNSYASAIRLEQEKALSPEQVLPWYQYATSTEKQRDPRNNREIAMCAEIKGLRAAKVQAANQTAKSDQALAEELKLAPFNLSPHMAYAIARHVSARPPGAARAIPLAAADMSISSAEIDASGERVGTVDAAAAKPVAKVTWCRHNHESSVVWLVEEDPPEGALLYLAAPNRAPSDDSAIVIDAVRGAVCEYYDALTARQHGGVAQDRAISKIQQALGMSWDDYKAERQAIAAMKKEP